MLLEDVFVSKTLSLPCQRLATESARHCQIFPMSFYLTELKSLKG